MDLQLTGRTALVTGASTGIGRAIAATLAAEGMKMAVVARRRELLESLGQEIVAAGGTKPAIIVADMMEAASPLRIRDEAMALLGSIEILVNCAGASKPLPVDAPDEKWDEAMTLNFTRVRQLTHAVLPHMQAKQWGRIVIDTSFTVKQPLENLILSNSIRAGVTGLAKTLSNEVAKDGISVNCICPGWIQTERVDHLLKDRAQRANISVDQARQAIASGIPMGRIGTVEEFAAAVAFLCSARASYITGVSLQVDGGIVKGLF